jgi:hypothetical protein
MPEANPSTTRSSMQRRVIIGGRPHWITTHDLDGEWYAVGKLGAETITVAAGNEGEAIWLWQEAAESGQQPGEAPGTSDSE